VYHLRTIRCSFVISVLTVSIHTCYTKLNAPETERQKNLGGSKNGTKGKLELVGQVSRLWASRIKQASISRWAVGIPNVPLRL